MNKISRSHVHIKDAKTFDDLYDITSKLKPKEKGDLFELVTFYIFKLSPTLNNKLQNIWLYDDIPIKIKRQLKLPEKDKGIDLLGVIDDKYYAIQSKFRQNKNSIVPWADLSTFFGLSFGINDKIKGGFLVTNTYDLCDEVINSDKVEPIYGDFFDNLPNNFFSNITKIINKQKVDEYVCKTPLKHQLECINKCDEYFKNHNRGYIEMACGSGKTLTSYWVDKKMNNKLTLVLVPSLYLLSQFYQDWVNQSYSENIKIYYILIGSDADISQDTKYKSNGLILEMDTQNIKQLIEKHKNEKTVIISTYQSSDKLFNTIDCFDVCIFDEAHKTVGQVGKQFSLMIKDSEDGLFNESDESDNDYGEDLEEEFDDEEVGDDLDEEIDDSNLSEDFENSDSGEEMGDGDPDEKIDEDHLGEETDENNVDENTDGETEEEKLDGELETETQNLKISKRLFMTATPKNYMGNLDDEQIISMDNEKYYGKEIFSYNTGKAIEDKRLVDYQLLTMIAQNKEIQQSISSNKLIKYKKLLDNEESNYLATVLIILKKIHDGTCSHMITYHSAIKRSKKFADLLVKINKELYKEDIFIESLDGSISMAKRNRIIKEFTANKKGVLCSAKVLNEGINIPIIDSVCFVDNRNSTIDIVQCIGRSLRLYENKKIANIIVPIFIDNLDSVTENSAFGSIISILKALKSTDEGVTEYFIHYENGKISGRKIVKYELYGKIAKNIEIKLDEWKKKLETTVWNVVDPFEAMYEKLNIWINCNGRLPSQHGKNLEEIKIGRWCSDKRKYYKKNKLSDDKISKLEKMDGWYWSDEKIIIAESFSEKYNKLKKWIDLNDRLPTQTNKNTEEYKLGIWCSHKKIEYRKKKLKNDVVLLLQNLPGWSWDDMGIFYKMYNRLKDWIRLNNRFPSHNCKDNEEKKLAVWCANKRNYYDKNKLDRNEIEKFENLPGWSWAAEDKFIDMYNKLKIWVSKHKNLPSQKHKNKDAEENKLGQWCSRQRKKHKINRLEENKIKMLENISEWHWSTGKKIILESFNEKYSKLEKWIELNNRIPMQTNKNEEEDGYGNWCANRRTDYKNNRLDENKIKMLEKLPGWFWKQTDAFSLMYNKVNEWIKISGRYPSCSSKNTEEKNLGTWCANKRSLYKKGKLSDDKIKILEELSNWSWGQADTFFDMCDELKIWVESNDRIPLCSRENKEEKRLGQWCQDRRCDFKNNKLPQDKVVFLEKIPYWFWCKSDNFFETYDKLKKWIEINNKIPSMMSKNIEEKKLGSWCSHKRENYKKNKLDDDKIKKMEEIDGWYWEKMIVVKGNKKSD